MVDLTSPAKLDIAAAEMLQRYQCPTPFHAVRTWFLGSIVSPAMHTSPMDAVGQLWGGALPAFESSQAANAFDAALVGGLWSRLTAHQDASKPFDLLAVTAAASDAGIRHLVSVRRQEIDGYIKGLFGGLEQVVLPAEGEEGVDQSHGSGLSGTRIGSILRTCSLKALGFGGALNFLSC